MNLQNPKLKIIRRILSYGVVLLILLLMVRVLALNWKAIPFSELRFNGWLFSLSWISLFLSFALSAVVWNNLLGGLNYKLGFVKAMKSIALSQVGRYVPGHIWGYVGRAELGKQEDIPRTASAVGLFVEVELIIASASLVFLAAYALSFRQWRTSLPGTLYLSLFLIPLEILLIHPRITNAFAAPLFRLFRREAPKVSLSYLTLLGFLLIYTVAWSFSGLGFYFMAKAVYPLGGALCIPMSGVYPAAWLIGFLSLLAPSGIGVREGSLVLLLSPFLPMPVSITLSLLARVWTTLFELICFLIFLRV